jgi:Ca2+-transporting ATPase
MTQSVETTENNVAVKEVRPPHMLNEEEILARYHTSEHGLSKHDAADLLARLGANQLREAQSRSAFSIFIAQFNDFLIWILIGAAALSGYMGELKDSIAIVVILAVNALIGFVQEIRAQKAMSALCKMSPPKAHIIRDGQDMVINAADLVPGDKVVIEAGSVIPADLRITKAANLRIDEAALTGESLPVDKCETALYDEELPIADRTNVAYMGTIAIYGRGEGIIYATGMATELGRIAELLDSGEEEPTPLQKRLDKLGKQLGVVALVICAVLFGVGIYQGHETLEMLMTAVSLAVAAIPEALPAVVTISLALGASRMVKFNSLVRKLPAVETLGSVTVICSDKTGTLTQNKMLVRQLWIGKEVFDVEGRGYEPKGKFSRSGSDAPINTKDSEFGDLQLMMRCMGLCNDSSLIPPMGQIIDWDVTGDPTEGGLTTLTAKAGFFRKTLNEAYPRIEELPFDSDRKMMTTLHQRKEDSHIFSFTKGGLDVVLPLCTHIRIDGENVVLTEQLRKTVLKANDDMASRGLRILVAAYCEFGKDKPEVKNEVLEKDLTFIGFTGVQDPPRTTVPFAIKTCRSAGIHTIMITGDHPATAGAIAHEIGMVDDDKPEVITGRELSDMTVEELKSRLDKVQVFARVSPEHKLKIIAALKAKNNIVAMTGDGVNDAPALKESDIGIAMGIQGTDVTKEAADMILLDDDFSTIVKAVGEGRRIFENIRKFVKFVVIGNTGEIWTMMLAPFFGLPIPLLPIQILWVNLVTDGLPGLALAVEPAEGDIMRRKPRPPQEPVLTGKMGKTIFIYGLFVGLVCLGTFYYQLNIAKAPIETARAWVFSVLCGLQLFNVLSVKCERELSIGRMLISPWMMAAVGICGLLQFLVVKIPAFAEFLHVTPLGFTDIFYIILISSSIFWIGEAAKILFPEKNQ